MFGSPRAAALPPRYLTVTFNVSYPLALRVNLRQYVYVGKAPAMTTEMEHHV